MKNLVLPLLLLALFVRDGKPVRCWRCTSDSNPACNDTFLYGSIENTLAFHFFTCDARTRSKTHHPPSYKSFCMKKKQYVDGRLVTSRSCTWKHKDDLTSTCPREEYLPEGVDTTFCETCPHDGCNSAAIYGETLALITALLGTLFFR